MFVWIDNGYWPLSQAQVRPVLNGSAVETLFLTFPGGVEKVVRGVQAQAVLRYCTSSSLTSAESQIVENHNGNGHSNGKKHHVWSEKSRVAQSKRKKVWWAEKKAREAQTTLA